MREKKFGKRFLTWVLVLMMTLSLLPVSAMAEDGEGTYRVDITIWNLPTGASSIENVTATLTGSSGTYSATVDSVSALGMISVSNVPKGRYNIQITGVGNDGVAVKTTAFLFSSDFNDTSGLASVAIMGGGSQMLMMQLRFRFLLIIQRKHWMDKTMRFKILPRI